MIASLKPLFLFLLAALAWSLIGTSCNTFRGVGRDVQHAGQHIEHAADR